jgi:uncharacterized protein
MSELKSIRLYGTLAEKLEVHETKLLQKYGDFIACRKGCSQCCILESIFPVEAYIISTSLKQADCRKLFTFPETQDKCVFLDMGLCSIYSMRPVICRTHGYPVLIDGKADFCPENFKDLASIDSEYILDLENINRVLASVNIMFGKENCGPFFMKDRITMAELKQYIYDKYKSSFEYSPGNNEKGTGR